MGAYRTSHRRAYPTRTLFRQESLVADFPDGADRADERIDRRLDQGWPNLGAWEVGDDLRTAAQLKLKTWGHAVAKQVYGRQADWDVDDPKCPGCTLYAKSWLLANIVWLKGDRDCARMIAEYRNELLAAQSVNGSWNDDTQLTAYVILGLDAAGSRAARDAVARAVTYLLDQQLADGGFAIATGSTDEITEVDAEVAMALRASK